MKMIICVCYLIFISYCVSKHDAYKNVGVSKSTTEMEINRDCTEIWCETYSFSEVERIYRGLFLSKLELLVLELMFDLDRDIILRQEGVKDFKYIVGSDGDGDSCCVTRQITHKNNTVKNVWGEPRHLVHLIHRDPSKNKYQYITQAECIGTGKCDGMCVLEDSVKTVLVYDIAARSITFDQVLVPSYCSCKRTDERDNNV